MSLYRNQSPNQVAAKIVSDHYPLKAAAGVSIAVLSAAPSRMVTIQCTTSATSPEEFINIGGAVTATDRFPVPDTKGPLELPMDNSKSNVIFVESEAAASVVLRIGYFQ